MSETPRGAAPLRGTQSFVGVMGKVWHAPSLTGVEIASRWLVGGALLLWFWPQVKQALFAIVAAATGVSGISPMQVTAIARSLHWAPFLGWLVLWLLLNSFARKLILRRLGYKGARWGVLLQLTVLRVAAICLVLAAWVGLMWRIAATVQWGPNVFASNQNLVGAFALAVVLTLALFMAWSVSSWLLWLAPVVAAERGCGAAEALRVAARSREVRGKIIEINLVMGIVKVALLVLGLTFSACPLPFQNVSTQQFLVSWWSGVGVLWLLASDFFHVVRTGSNAALYRALKS